MKVLLYDTTCAFLTPGGKMTHALKLQQEISKQGVDIQFARWWDKSQENADIIHFLAADYRVASLAKQRGIKTFFSCIFDFESNKSEFDKKKTILKNRLVEMSPDLLGLNKYWRTFPLMDEIQFMHSYDRDTALRYFPKYINKEKTVIIPHAYDPSEMFISNASEIKSLRYPKKYLVSVANISERKQTVKLAQYAKLAHVPIVFMGSRNVNDPYFKSFEQLVDNEYVFYPGYVSKEMRDCIERNASGYVLLSQGESGCIAVYEAAAYKLPLLLSNLPWAWGYDTPTNISFADINDDNKAVKQLREFYDKSCLLNQPPFRIFSWKQIATRYIEEYNRLLNVK